MLERETLPRLRHGPGLRQRLRSLVPHWDVDFRAFDMDSWLLSMADAEPEYIGYLNDESERSRVNGASRNERRSS